jgi:hypothetical protein
MLSLEHHTIDGLTMRLTYERWVEHISPRHPEVTFADVEEALTQTTRICSHKEYANCRVYEGHPRPRGLHHTEIPLVAVQLDNGQTGWVVTTYRALHRYQGVQLWPA